MIATVNENVILLYGTIYDGDGRYIVYELNRVFSKYDDVTVHLHTPGGDVFEGNLIYNTLANTKTNVNIVVDGLSASMGSIIMLAGKKISMASNAFVMVHAPWGSAFGTHIEMTSAAKLLQSMEKLFVNQYSKRTGKTVDELKQWMIGDNWFSAEEALEAGLIDEIIEPVFTEENEVLQAESLKKMDLVALQKSFKSKFEASTQDPSQQHINKQIINNMKKQLINALSLANVSESSSDTAIIEAIQSQLSNSQKESVSKDETIQRLTNEIKAFKDNAISSTVASAIQAGKISGSQREKYENIGKNAGVETLNSILEDMTGKPASVIDRINYSVGQTSTTETWDELKKKPGVLEKLQADDLETFKALFKAKFGTEFKQ